VSIIEFDIRKFIDDVFKTVRSAEVAFETVMTFQHITTRESFSTVMKTKFGDVLEQYDKQVCNCIIIIYLRTQAVQAVQIK